jgi:site-specific recombinase
MERAALRSERPPAQDAQEQERERSLPDAETFGRLVSPTSPRHRAVQQLHGLLVACRPGAALQARVEALEQLSRWLQNGRAVPPPPTAVPGESPQVMRMRMLLHALEASPPFGQRVAFTLARVLEESVGGGLFARLGLPTDRGFFAETIDRVSRRYLPEPRDDRDLLQFVARLFPWKASVRFLSSTPSELVRDLTSRLGSGQPGTNPWAPLLDHVTDASALLATRISALGLSDVLRARSPRVPLTQSPFFRLPRAIDALVDALDRGGDLQARASECHALVQDCRRVSESVVENLERYGVSVDVVYRIELLAKSLVRLDALVRQLEPCPDLERAARAKSLLTELIGTRLRDRELGDIVRGNLHLLARKIIERAGHTGEHYITTSRGEYAKMLLSAGGGGVLTAGTTALKFLVQWGHYAPFVEGVLASTNYAVSFIVMQLLGFTLATKQPSMTAAALAGTLRETAGHPDLSALVSMIARITRSQLAAAIGNIGLVIPSAFAFDLFWRAQHGKSFLDDTTAHYVLHSLHPLQSGTVFFAALTGVILWSSSIVAGWLENWAVYRRLPDAIAEHRLGRLVGRRTMAWFSRFLLRNIAGFGGNTSLGFMLGMTPVMGKFFGLPLDVRHVTLSTGALTLSVLALGPEALSTEAFWSAAAGIAVIGTLNFGVSFVLALAVALRARQADRSDRWRLLRSVVATYMRSPLQFFLPPREATILKVHGPVSVAPPPPVR